METPLWLAPVSTQSHDLRGAYLSVVQRRPALLVAQAEAFSYICITIIDFFYFFYLPLYIQTECTGQ